MKPRAGRRCGCAADGTATSRSHPHGFSLVEVLVAMALVVVVGGMMAGWLAGGWRLWSRIVEGSAVRTAAVRLLDRVEADLSSSVALTEFGWTGDAGRLSLVRPVSTAGDGLVRVEYIRSPAGVGVLRRETRLIWPAPGGTREPMVTEAMTPVGGFEVAYAASPTAEPAWADRWLTPTNPPAAIRIRVRPGPDRGALERWILLPPGPAVRSRERETGPT